MLTESNYWVTVLKIKLLRFRVDEFPFDWNESDMNFTATPTYQYTNQHLATFPRIFKRHWKILIRNDSLMFCWNSVTVETPWRVFLYNWNYGCFKMSWSMVASCTANYVLKNGSTSMENKAQFGILNSVTVSNEKRFFYILLLTFSLIWHDDDRRSHIQMKLSLFYASRNISYRILSPDQ